MQGWNRPVASGLASALLLLAGTASAQVKRTRTLRLPDGSAAAEARIVPAHGAELLALATCDAEGRVTLPDAQGVDHVIVIGPSALPCDVPLDAAAVEVVLPLVRLAGRLVVDGTPPAQPVTLGLLPKIQHGPPLFASPELARILGPPPLRQPTTLTDAQGRFDFGFVQDGQTYWIGAPREYAPPPPSRPLQAMLVVDHPSTDVLFEVHALPLVAGRVLGPDGQPAAKIAVSIEVNAVTPGSGSGGGVTTGEDGRFSLAIADVPRTSLDIHFDDRATGARRALSLGAGSGSVDVHDVRLEAPRSLRLLARDPQGQPLAGAIATTLDGHTSSEPAGADGLIDFPRLV